jgi:hypothetical protein
MFNNCLNIWNVSPLILTIQTCKNIHDPNSDCKRYKKDVNMICTCSCSIRIQEFCGIFLIICLLCIRIFSSTILSIVSRPTVGPTHPPIQWVQAVLSPGVKQLGHEADHSPPSSAEVKNVWGYTSTPLIHLNGMVLS